MQWYVWVLIILLGGGLVCGIAVPARIARRIFRDLLVRTDPEKWTRKSSAPDDPDHFDMYLKAKAWGDAHRDAARDVQTVSADGLKLCGRYFDFGHDRAVLILPGRSEGLIYSQFFAPPYERAGYNVLVVDVRAHGESEGIYDTAGNREKGDALIWLRFLHDDLGNREVMIHGVCIGGATALRAASDGECPPYLSRVVTEGAYGSFYAVMKQRLRTKGKPIYPFIWFFFLWLWIYTGTRRRDCAPLRDVPRMRCPVLMISGREDISTLPAMTEKLYAACGSADKSVVWIDRGSHSHLRYYRTEAYDAAVAAFLSRETETANI